METFVIYYNINPLTAPTRMRSKEFTDKTRAERYYAACRADWFDKALKEYEATKQYNGYQPNFDDYFKETEHPDAVTEKMFEGEIGWTRYSFCLAKA